MATEVLMPRQGQSVESCIIVDWKVNEGDVVTAGQVLCEVETDKATFEVEATADGTVLGIFYPAEADVEVLKVIAVIGKPGEDISALRPAERQKADPVGASPRAKMLATQKGVDVSAVVGTGPNGRVIERDVAAELVSVVSTSMDDFPGTVKEIPVKGVRKVVADRMRFSLQATAQLTLNTSADARAVLDYRAKCKAAPEEVGVGGISINDVVLYATVKTLGEFPELNAHMLGEKIVEFGNVHLGFAVDTPRGLMVPVIRYADRMSLKQLAAETNRLAKACIDGTIDPDALKGGTFTVTNLGAMGIESFTPVLNAPEVGILGVCAIQLKPMMKGAEVEFVPHMGLSLTFDHAAADGAPAARFLASLRTKLAVFECTLAE